MYMVVSMEIEDLKNILWVNQVHVAIDKVVIEDAVECLQQGDYMV